MLIMHVIPGDIWAGAESQVYYTLRELSRSSEHKITVVLFNEKELYQRLVNENVTIHVIDEEANNSLVISYKIKYLLEKTRPDIVHVHEYKSHILTCLANLFSGSRSKIVRTLHGQTASPLSVKYIKVFTILQLENILLRYLTGCIVAVSRDIEHLLKKKYKKSRICLINNAVQITPDIDVNTADIRNKFGVGINTFWIGTAARLVNVKNLDMLIDAAKILSEKNIGDFKVSVFGEGPLEKTLQLKIDQYDLTNNVNLHGHCNNLHSILKSFDVFVLTSLNEGLPMSLLEAMSVGTPPICTKVGGMQEVIEDTKSGFLIKSGSPDELVESLVLIREDNKLRSTVGNNARNRVQEKYSIETNVKMLLELYESL